MCVRQACVKERERVRLCVRLSSVRERERACTRLCVCVRVFAEDDWIYVLSMHTYTHTHTLAYLHTHTLAHFLTHTHTLSLSLAHTKPKKLGSIIKGQGIGWPSVCSYVDVCVCVRARVLAQLMESERDRERASKRQSPSRTPSFSAPSSYLKPHPPAAAPPQPHEHLIFDTASCSCVCSNREGRGG